MVEEDGYGNKDDMEEGKQRGEQEDGNKQLKQVMVEERKGGQEQPAGESIQEQQQHAGQTQVEPLASKQRHLSMVERFKRQLSARSASSPPPHPESLTSEGIKSGEQPPHQQQQQRQAPNPSPVKLTEEVLKQHLQQHGYLPKLRPQTALPQRTTRPSQPHVSSEQQVLEDGKQQQQHADQQPREAKQQQLQQQQQKQEELKQNDGKQQQQHADQQPREAKQQHLQQQQQQQQQKQEELKQNDGKQQQQQEQQQQQQQGVMKQLQDQQQQGDQEPQQQDEQRQQGEQQQQQQQQQQQSKQQKAQEEEKQQELHKQRLQGEQQEQPQEQQQQQQEELEQQQEQQQQGDQQQQKKEVLEQPQEQQQQLQEVLEQPQEQLQQGEHQQRQKQEEPKQSPEQQQQQQQQQHQEMLKQPQEQQGQGEQQQQQPPQQPEHRQQHKDKDLELESEQQKLPLQQRSQQQKQQEQDGEQNHDQQQQQQQQQQEPHPLLPSAPHAPHALLSAPSPLHPSVRTQPNRLSASISKHIKPTFERGDSPPQEQLLHSNILLLPPDGFSATHAPSSLPAPGPIASQGVTATQGSEQLDQPSPPPSCNSSGSEPSARTRSSRRYQRQGLQQQQGQQGVQELHAIVGTEHPDRQQLLGEGLPPALPGPQYTPPLLPRGSVGVLEGEVLPMSKSMASKQSDIRPRSSSVSLGLKSSSTAGPLRPSSSLCKHAEAAARTLQPGSAPHSHPLGVSSSSSGRFEHLLRAPGRSPLGAASADGSAAEGGMNVLRPGSAGSGSSSSSRRRNEKPQQAEQVQGPQHPVPPACVQADGTSNARAPALGQTAGAAGHAVAGVPAAPTLDHSPQAAQLQGRAFDEDDPFQVLQESMWVLAEIESLIREALGLPPGSQLCMEDQSVLSKVPPSLLDALEGTINVVLMSKGEIEDLLLLKATKDRGRAPPLARAQSAKGARDGPQYAAGHLGRPARGQSAGPHRQQQQQQPWVRPLSSRVSEGSSNCSTPRNGKSPRPLPNALANHPAPGLQSSSRANIPGSAAHASTYPWSHANGPDGPGCTPCSRTPATKAPAKLYVYGCKRPPAQQYMYQKVQAQRKEREQQSNALDLELYRTRRQRAASAHRTPPPGPWLKQKQEQQKEQHFKRIYQVQRDLEYIRTLKEAEASAAKEHKQVLLQAEGSITSLRSQRVTANTAARWLAFEQLMKP